jgi:uncharacterized repeat protein (TIGR01451 family)
MTRTRRTVGAGFQRSFKLGMEQLEDRAVPAVDVSVLKTTDTADTSGNVTAGDTVQYTVVVSNAASATEAATGTAFTDDLASVLTNVSWTSTVSGGATGNTASGTGDISETLDLPAGSSVTYTITGELPTSATGTLDNTATATVASGLTDSDTTNNSDSVSNTITAVADVSVTKTDGLTSVSPGQDVTYTVTVTNVGGLAVTGATLTDNFPAALTGVTWTSTASGGATGNDANGSGSISDTLNLPVGASVTYTITGTVGATTATTITNTATVTATGDADTTNNTATDVNTLANKTVDLAITKTDNSKFAIRGQPTTYTITVTNVGTTPAFGVQVQDVWSSEFAGASWTSTAAGGATGNAASGSGDITETLDLPAGASVTYTAVANVANSARGGLTNTVTVTPAAGATDSNPANNTASDRDTVLPKAVPAFFNQFTVGADQGANGHVKVFAPDGTMRMSFIAFEGFNGGVRVASGDVNADGINDIIVGAGLGAGNGHIKVFDGSTGQLLFSFFSFQNFLGGVDVAVGDVNGDGSGDLIVGSGLGAGHIKVYSLAGGAPAEIASFFAYTGFTGGISVAAGDVNGDGVDDIITGPVSGPAHVKVFTFAPTGTVTLPLAAPLTQRELASFIAIPSYTGGIDVAAGDLIDDPNTTADDGRAEFVITPLSGGGGNLVQVYSIDSTTPLKSFNVDFPGPDRGLRVALVDADGDGDLDIVVAGGPGRGAKVRAFDATSLSMIDDFTAFDGFQGGVFVG